MNETDRRKLNREAAGRLGRRLRRAILPVCMVVSMAVSVTFSMVAGVVFSVAIGSTTAMAAEIDEEIEQDTAVQEKSTAKADAVTIRVEGSFQAPDRDKILERINEIRQEACEEGVRDPATGEPMRAEDYAPLVWSYELEEVAARRAVECTILRDHMRPDGTECFTALPDSEAFSMETLAWGYGGILEAVEGWYSEKSSYVEETGAPAGHYMALISPSVRYVAAADFDPAVGQDACAGAFGRSARMAAEEEQQRDSAEERSAALLAQTHWEISLDKAVLSSAARLALVRTIRLITTGMWNR